MHAELLSTRSILKSTGLVLVGLGFISLGITLAPFAPAAQWKTERLFEAMAAIPEKFARKKEIPTSVLINHLPQNTDRTFTQDAKHKTLAGIAKTEVATTRKIRARVPATVPVQKEQSKTNTGAPIRNQPNSLAIASVGIKMPIVEGTNAASALNKGGWRITETSTPDKGGNTVIACHRYLYTKSPNVGKNCYHLDKVETGDTIEVYWKGKTYIYRVREKKIVQPTEISVLDNTAKPIITILTCTPVYSTRYRLIVIGELIS